MADTLTITDNRTGNTYDVPITDETIRAIDLRKIKVNAGDFGMMTYDPAFMNTASCRSAITFIDERTGFAVGPPMPGHASMAPSLRRPWLRCVRTSVAP